MAKTGLGPYLSLSLPVKRARTPITKKATDEQLESSVLDQPYWFSNSLNRSPNANKNPMTTSWVRKAPAKTL